VSSFNGLVDRSGLRMLVGKLAFWRARDRADLVEQSVYFAIASLLGVVFFFPFYWLVKVAVSWPPTNLYSGQPSLGIENPSYYNFVEVFFAIPFPQFLLNSVVIVSLAIVGNLVFNSLAAYALTMDFHGKRGVQLVLITAMMIPFQTTIIPAFLVTNELGLVNTHLGIVLPLATIIINILVLVASFEAVPESILESARLDGASELYILFGVYWPLSKPALATNVILSFVFAWNAFLWPLIVVSDRALEPLPLALANFQTQFQGNFALTYAFSIMVVLPIVVMFLLLQRQFIESVVMTSVKQ
jgi:ABC-type glycerol-3-phosphate transport system permease component